MDRETQAKATQAEGNAAQLAPAKVAGADVVHVRLAGPTSDQEAYYADVYRSTANLDVSTVVGGPGHLHTAYEQR